MCVTTSPANMGGTMALTYATLLTEDPRTEHITYYQNTAYSPGPNCMLLHIPGDDISLVDGPQDTTDFMRAITAGLPPIRNDRGGSSETTRTMSVHSYGNYTVVLAQHCSDIPSVLQEVPAKVRPVLDDAFVALLAWYDLVFPGYSFVLACWRGSVEPRHPIAVKYVPHNDDVLFVPGLDGHDGSLPQIGRPMRRNFKVGFAVEGRTHPFTPAYAGFNGELPYWAPRTVTGFYDNRYDGPNHDYVVPRESVEFGYSRRLMEELIN